MFTSRRRADIRDLIQRIHQVRRLSGLSGRVPTLLLPPEDLAIDLTTTLDLLVVGRALAQPFVRGQGHTRDLLDPLGKGSILLVRGLALVRGLGLARSSVLRASQIPLRRFPNSVPSVRKRSATRVARRIGIGRLSFVVHQSATLKSDAFPSDAKPKGSASRDARNIIFQNSVKTRTSATAFAAALMQV
mmetsp:Transcript_10231/g.28691  ORF Transcript_10231/g.28691 Transcript_10231/m.28691 type:complete len:189 (-) Transcript_10231:1279-1845(-)